MGVFPINVQDEDGNRRLAMVEKVILHGGLSGTADGPPWIFYELNGTAWVEPAPGELPCRAAEYDRDPSPPASLLDVPYVPKNVEPDLDRVTLMRDAKG